MNHQRNRCDACGTEPIPDAEFCHRCGARIAPEKARPWEGPPGEGWTGDRGAPSGEGPAKGAGRPSSPTFGARETDENEVEPHGDDRRAGSATGGFTPGAEKAGEEATGAAGASGPAGGEGPSSAAGPAAEASGYSPSGGGQFHAQAGEASSPPANNGLAGAIRGEYAIRIGEWMSRGWAIFTQAGGLFIGFAAIVWLVFFFALPLLLFLGPMLGAGFFVAALRLRGGRSLQFSDFWLPFNDFFPLFLAWIVGLALMFAGLLTCGIVTVYLGVGYLFAALLIMDRRMDFWEALESSRQAVTSHWLGLAVFAFLLFALNLVAFLVTASIGLVVSLPLTCCALVEAYADIFGVKGGMPERRVSAAFTQAPRSE